LGCGKAETLLVFLYLSSQSLDFAIALLDQSIEALALLGKDGNFVFSLSSEALLVIFQLSYSLLEVFSLGDHGFVLSSESSDLTS
jgi:hypothetical protein